METKEEVTSDTEGKNFDPRKVLATDGKYFLIFCSSRKRWHNLSVFISNIGVCIAWSICVWLCFSSSQLTESINSSFLHSDGDLSRLLSMDEVKARAAAHKCIMKEIQGKERNEQLKIQEKMQQDKYKVLQGQYTVLMDYHKKVAKAQEPGSSVTVYFSETETYGKQYAKYQSDLLDYQQFQQSFLMEQQKQAMRHKQDKQIQKLRLRHQITAHENFVAVAANANNPANPANPSHVDNDNDNDKLPKMKTLEEIHVHNKSQRKHALYVPYTKVS